MEVAKDIVVAAINNKLIHVELSRDQAQNNNAAEAIAEAYTIVHKAVNDVFHARR